jgi:predicted lipid-binding transport protein (Tim44 family)
LILEHPALIVPLLLAAAGLFYMFQTRRNSIAATEKGPEKAKAFAPLDSREAALRTQVNGADPAWVGTVRAREAVLRTTASSRGAASWVGALQASDPEFQLPALLDKAKHVFLAIQQAWLARDLSPIRGFVSDANFQRLDVQLKLMQLQGVRNVFADLQVLDLQIIGLERSHWFDTVHILINAQMRDVDVPAGQPDAEALRAAKKAALEPFAEVWSFIRKPGTKTRAELDVCQGLCPNCGAPFQGGTANNCAFCGAIVNSGNYDWTLSEISQGVEYSPHPEQVPGLAEARQEDPALNLEMLEDRASLIFWKWIEAESHGEAKLMSKLCTPQYLLSTEKELRALRAAGRKRVFFECAVGSVDTWSFVSMRDGGLRASVEIRWSAKMADVPENAASADFPTLPQRWIFTLHRKAGAKTNTGNGMSTSRCPNCNASLTDSMSPSCDFCRAELSSKAGDWILARAVNLDS